MSEKLSILGAFHEIANRLTQPYLESGQDGFIELLSCTKTNETKKSTIDAWRNETNQSSNQNSKQTKF